jgi:hypothetical protein
VLATRRASLLKVVGLIVRSVAVLLGPAFPGVSCAGT